MKYFFAIVLAFFTFSAHSAPQDSLQQTIFQRINAYRVKHHLAPLELNAWLSQEAQQHSADMASQRVPFGHDGFRGRMRDVFHHFKSVRGAAENVAYVYEDGEQVVPLWIESSGHRKNIEGKFNMTGIGIAYNPDGRVYVTQIFINKPLNLR